MRGAAVLVQPAPHLEPWKGCISLAKIAPVLLTILRCPVTGSSLVQDGGVLRSVAHDSSGNTVEYAIDESIPVLLRAELRSDDLSDLIRKDTAPESTPAQPSEEPAKK